MADSPTDRALDAAKVCCERWGLSKVTVDDIAAAAGISRATLYRLFPGGRDTVFEALRQRNLTEFFTALSQQTAGIDQLDELLVQVVVAATQRLRDDEHLALMLAAEPGAVNSEMSVEGLPRIINASTAFLVPLVEPYLGVEQARAVSDLLARLVISYFLAPSELIDLGDVHSATAFVRAHILSIALTNPLGG